jgi:hypothetical protein
MSTPLFGMVKVHVGEIPKAKLSKLFNGNTVRLTNADLSGDRVMLLHPHTAKMIEASKRSGKGVNISVTPPEAFADLAYHHNVGEGMHGGSLWSWLKEKAWPWIKQNWKPLIKPALSAIADRVAPLAGPEGVAARAALKTVTGVGVGKSRVAKGSDAAKERMAKLRAMRKGKRGTGLSGASFLMP